MSLLSLTPPFEEWLDFVVDTESFDDQVDLVKVLVKDNRSGYNNDGSRLYGDKDQHIEIPHHDAAGDGGVGCCDANGRDNLVFNGSDSACNSRLGDASRGGRSYRARFDAWSGRGAWQQHREFTHVEMMLYRTVR